MSQLVALRDVELFVQSCGSGSPILFVHGFPLDHTMWKAQIDEFSKTHHVIAPDLRGFGQSEDSPGTVTMEQFADDLAELLDILEVRSPVTLCGLSMGGYIAWQFWKRHPERLAKLILCDTRALPDSPEARKTRLEGAERVVREGQRFLVDSMPEKIFAAETSQEHPELIAAVRGVIHRNSPEGIAAAQRGMADRPDVSSWLPEIDLPALVIVGEEDSVSPVDEMQAIAKALPKGKFILVPHAGHMSPLEQPDVVNAAIREFLG